MIVIIKDQGPTVDLYITDIERGTIQATSTSLKFICDICDGLGVHKEDITFYNAQGQKGYL